MYVALMRSATEQAQTALANTSMSSSLKSNGCRQVAKVAESDADYRKFYIENSSATVRLRAETKCASSLPASLLLLQHTSSLFVLDCVILPLTMHYSSGHWHVLVTVQLTLQPMRAYHCAYTTGIMQCICSRGEEWRNDQHM